MMDSYLLWAVGLGALSAISLLIGSIVGLVSAPPARVTGTLAAFGAGALIAALAVELVAPTLEELGEPHGLAAFLGLVGGAIVGGVVFVILDAILASRGGFLRKTATTITYLTGRRRERDEALLKDLCTVSVLRLLPADRVALLTRDVRPLSFEDGELLFEQGADADRLYFVRSGRVELLRDGATVECLEKGGVAGETSLVARTKRLATGVARGRVETLALDRQSFDRWREECPELDRGVRDEAEQRLQGLGEQSAQAAGEATEWAEEAVRALRSGAEVPTPRQLREMRESHGGAGLAVWLGMLIDGIPESLVLGSGFAAALGARLSAGSDVAFAEVIPYALVAGLFLSNFPEALSSSVAMREQGFSCGRIVSLWTSLVALTAVGSGIGYLAGELVPHTALITLEGLAVGAMLVAIASTMIPEAVHLGGGRLTGLGTLAGFLATISFRLVDGV